MSSPGIIRAHTIPTRKAKDGRGTPGVLGVRREDKNKWERREPITPEQVVQLVAQGMRIVVQPSTRRVFADEEYRQAGAIIQDELNECGTSVGVKECPIDALLANRMYLSFSHTIKAQPYNMPLLDALLEKNVRMIDYECITETGMRGSNRLVAFGAFAGYAGAIDFLRGLGERFLALDFSTPLLHIGSSFMYPSLDDARRAVKAAGETIGQFGLPAALCPFTVVFTGTGKVSRGALDIFQLLPHEMIEPPALTDLCQGGAVKADRNKLYLSVATAKHMVRRRDGQPFDRKDYYENPDAHVPVFQETVLPYCTAIVNCMYWDPRFPKLFTSADLEQSVRTGQDKLLGVCDITCDEIGSVPTKEFTSIEDPFYVYNALTDQVGKSLDGPGVVFHAVDHLPCEIPREASLPPSWKLAPRSVAAMTRCRSSAAGLIAVGLAIVASFMLQGCDSDTQAANVSAANQGADEVPSVQIRGLSPSYDPSIFDEEFELTQQNERSTLVEWYVPDEFDDAISHCKTANDCWGVYEDLFWSI